MMKDFSKLNDLIKGVEVNGELQQIINLMSIARSAVSAASNLSNNYARSYTQVQQIQYDDKGKIQDVTPAENQSIANTIISDCLQQLRDLQIQWDNINGSIQSFPVTPDRSDPFPVLGNYTDIVSSKLKEICVFVLTNGKWQINRSSSESQIDKGCHISAMHESETSGLSTKPCIVIHADEDKWAIGLFSAICGGDGVGYILLHDPFQDSPRQLYTASNTTIRKLCSYIQHGMGNGSQYTDVAFGSSITKATNVNLIVKVDYTDAALINPQQYMNLHEDVSSYVTSKANVDVVELAKNILTSPNDIISQIPV